MIEFGARSNPAALSAIFRPKVTGWPVEFKEYVCSALPVADGLKIALNDNLQVSCAAVCRPYVYTRQ
jgi:hypothetical protein